MCEWGNTVNVETKSGVASVDSCIAELVSALNESGIGTVASCCGHGSRPGCIALADGRELFIAANCEHARRLDLVFGEHGCEHSEADGQHPAIVHMDMCSGCISCRPPDPEDELDKEYDDIDDDDEVSSSCAYDDDIDDDDADGNTNPDEEE